MRAGLIRADASGKKELLATGDGFRESEQSWHELLVSLRDQNGMVIHPALATGDGALGFWKAARKVWPSVKQQRCWVHKTANGADLLAEVRAGQGHSRPRRDLRGREPGRRRRGLRPFPRQVLGEARHGRHLPGQGSREPARVRQLSRRALDVRPQHEPGREHLSDGAPADRQDKGCLSRATALALVFKLAKSAERHWRRLNGSDRLAEIVRGVRFRAGDAVSAAEDHAAA